MAALGKWPPECLLAWRLQAKGPGAVHREDFSSSPAYVRTRDAALPP